MLFHNCPITVGLGKIRRSFIHYLGYAMHQRSVNDIAVARDPANICSTEKDVLFFKFKDPLGSSIEMRKVATCAVHYTLGFASRPRSIENVKRMSAFNWLRRAVGLSTIHCACKHSNRQLWYHRHVYCDAVAFAYTNAL